MVTGTVFTAGEVVFTGFCGGDYRSIGIGTQQKYAMTSKVRYDETLRNNDKMRNIMTSYSERGFAIYDDHVIMLFVLPLHSS